MALVMSIISSTPWACCEGHGRATQRCDIKVLLATRSVTEPRGQKWPHHPARGAGGGRRKQALVS